MPSDLVALWCARRALHERWGVPLADIAKACNVTQRTIALRAGREDWSGNRPAAPVAEHAGDRLEAVIDAEIEALQRSAGEGPDERRARAISVLVKSWGEMHAIRERMVREEGEANGRDDGRLAPGDLDERRTLLARLVAGVPLEAD